MRLFPTAVAVFAVAAFLVDPAAPGSGPRRAGAIEDLVTPRSLGIGNALRADAAGALGPMLNPAAMAFTRSYEIELMYGLRAQDLGHELNLSLVDSITSKVAAGLYYSYVHSTPHFSVLDPAENPIVPDKGTADVTREGHETGLSIGVPLGQYFALGLTAKYVNVATTMVNPAYATNSSAPQTLTLDSTTSDASANGFTMDVGADLRLANGKFMLGVVGYNLVPLRSVEAPMSLGMGIAYKPTNLLTFALDSVVYFDRNRLQLTPDQLAAGQVQGDRKVTARLGGGMEWLIAGKVPLRLGAMWDSGRPGTYLSCGLGYMHPKVAVDLSYRQQVAGGIESLVVLGLRVFVQ